MIAQFCEWTGPSHQELDCIQLGLIVPLKDVSLGVLRHTDVLNSEAFVSRACSLAVRDEFSRENENLGKKL